MGRLIQGSVEMTKDYAITGAKTSDFWSKQLEG